MEGKRTFLSTSVVFSTVLSVFFFSGGRWTLCVLFSVLYLIYKNNGQSHSTTTNTLQKKVKESPIYAVDFTNTSFSKSAKPASETIPKSVPLSRKPKGKRIPKIIRANPPPTKDANKPLLTSSPTKFMDSNIIIFYTSLTGASEKAAKDLHDSLSVLPLPNKPRLLDIDNDVDDLDDYFIKIPEEDNLVYILVLPSYDTDSPIDYFLETLQETSNDFRIDKFPLKKLMGFTILAIGDSESWPEKFCYQGKIADKRISKLGARRIFPMGTICIKTGGESKINEWINLFSGMLSDNESFFLDHSDDINEDGNSDDGDDDEETVIGEDELVDVEDMGKMMRTSTTTTSPENEIKEMVSKNSPTFKSLTKQGYTVVGSHSGVKICRWTKSALRGRGSCYKFAFYGIKSHLCMETTPSLSCSNKCVFCWRHGTNPVGTSWRWQVDGPELILKGALEGHYKKIKQMRGVPGVSAERFNEAFTVKHCALSLVGEPIFYPYINEFVGMLHERKISSFLVCNAQHPEQLNAMNKVTQLYVSIDAPTKDELKKIDRPLFKDYWERLNKCLDILKTTQFHQRTVFRLTLVKGFNMGQVAAYADLVEKGCPSQIEIKGATFCGSSSGNPLTMQNIPFYEECQGFVRNLNKELSNRGLNYDIAAEHAHSCCILMADTKFKIGGVWNTHIDYDKFFKLLESGEHFTDLDYIKPTPEWAVWESTEAGFNPEDTRFNRKEEKLKNKILREESTNGATEDW